LNADTVANLGFEAVMEGKLLCITGRSSKVSYALTKFLPRTVMINIMKKQSKQFRKIETY
jgi:short-subunit dehydrogenase